MPDQYFLGVHCHYYQPPRGNPFSRDRLVEPDAAPFPNWNARITAECYEPNARIGNYQRISFNLGETLAAWLADNAPDVFRAFIDADRENVRLFGAGNAIAQPHDHTILPLARDEDRRTQVRWGKAAFRKRFGREATGLWLPEMAVDNETLETLIDEGIEWTILTERQVDGKPQGAGPYWIRVASGKRIKVFVRDEGLSNDIAFSLGLFGGAGRWARQVLVPRRRETGQLTLIATDGETFGHHWPQEEQFLHWLLSYEANAAGYEVITLERYADLLEPLVELKLKENTAWSCQHGLSRWATGCTCTPGDSSWKGALRRALDNLRFEIDMIYSEELKQIDASANTIKLRDAYIDVALGSIAKEDFHKQQEIDGSKDKLSRLAKLIEAQYFRQRMYDSSTFFFPDLDSPSTKYGLAHAAYAIKLTREATDVDLTPSFRRDLSIAMGPDRESETRITGADLLDLVQAEMA